MTTKKSSTKPKTRRANGRERQPMEFPNPTLTLQSPKDECDINQIMARVQRTGEMPRGNPAIPRYAFAPSVDYREALEIVRLADEKFDSLPEQTRAEFQNNPEQMLQWVEHPDRTLEDVEAAISENYRPPVQKPEEKPAAAASGPPAKPSEPEPKTTDGKPPSAQLPT